MQVDNPPPGRLSVKHDGPPTQRIRDVGQLESHDAHVVNDADAEVPGAEMQVGRAGWRGTDALEEGMKMAFDHRPVPEPLGGVRSGPERSDRVAQARGEARPVEAVERLEEGGGGSSHCD